MQGGVAIDLSKLNTVHINKKAGTLTVGPGVRFEEIFDPLYAAGWQVRTSQRPSPRHQVWTAR
jgi:FAD/FMN-containing dehydrogenase